MQVNSKALLAGLTGTLAIAATLIINAEGYSNHSHPDPVGNTEICYGHKGTTVIESDAQCLHLLKEDVDHANAVINKYVVVQLSDKTRASLVDFIYNVGGRNFSRSTLLRLLNKGRIKDACEQLPRWNRASGKVLLGLVRRREAEKKLCIEGVNG